MIRIVHFSDWHGEAYKLPEADLYVSTGDMYSNYVKRVRKEYRKQYYTDSVHDPKHDAREQLRAAALYYKHGGFQPNLGSPNAPLICVRGNHDYVDAAPMFEGCNLVHEFVNNEVIEVCGLRITGHRGVPWINGTWADEMNKGDLMDRVRAMDPSCDVYVTHYPAHGSGLSVIWGLDGMQNWFDYEAAKPHVLHLFGHIHEHGGQMTQFGRVTYSNASTCWNVIEGDPVNGWKSV